MCGLKNKRQEWIFEENIVEIQRLRSETCSYEEYLIEIVKTSDGKRCYVNIYKIIAIGGSYKNSRMALIDAMRFLDRQSK